MSGKVVRAADVCGVPKPPQLSAVEPTPPTFSEAGWFPWRLRNPLPCSRWAQHPGTSTDMASSLRTPSFTSCSSSSTDTDDDDGVRGTCKDASMCRESSLSYHNPLQNYIRRTHFKSVINTLGLADPLRKATALTRRKTDSKSVDPETTLPHLGFCPTSPPEHLSGRDVSHLEQISKGLQ
ncbi:uncharacterized protein LOC130541832 isoform X3 [Ursus arctos]|uniref:uncharacterized protein LOC130541832 isoform X3 n=1 Tax=Ursus arctos TaxID=9644 RepID=UPI002547FFFD|nr:uncharacterized protein LOC130541832 isoform X3 [Ursus arctos]